MAIRKPNVTPTENPTAEDTTNTTAPDYQLDSVTASVPDVADVNYNLEFKQLLDELYDILNTASIEYPAKQRLFVVYRKYKNLLK